ncbi:hypothetical protein G4V62_16170 [Bacillaceae bacterium SIJ1]|uniref:hypothetical protein n=1 Tax=Litoribacterium kuwaitense TaxID=1398745 RepID=UPI0013ECA1C6|nr:hypothetical protein [Litoribacterium kuwaitense]NGP46408.1 hypothetical protein [Litoribacterium kuwaitense]
MRLIFNEIKKILTWKMVLLLIVVNAALYFLFISFHIDNYPSGLSALESHQIGVEMVEKYGSEIDDEELADFKEAYERRVAEADDYLQSREAFVNAGLDSYEDFKNAGPENREQTELINQVMFEEQVDLFWELQERERLLDFHDGKEESLEADINRANPSQQVLLKKLQEKELYQVYPEAAIENYKHFITNVAIALVISVVIVVSPLYLYDRLRHMPELQYTSKKGRHLFKTKAAAGFLSSLIVTTGLFIVYYGIYATNGTSIFFDVSVHRFIGGYSWYNLTFFQYIAVATMAVYVLGSVFALLAMSFSSMMQNYVSLIGIQTPMIAGLMMFGLTYLVTDIISLYNPQWLAPVSYGLMMAISVAMFVIMWRREKIRDVLVS